MGRIGRLLVYFSTLMLVETPIILHFRDNLNGFAVLWMLAGAICLLYTSPSPRDRQKSRMPSSA